MTPLGMLALQAGQGSFVNSPEMLMGLQYFEGDIYLLQQKASVPAKALVLSSLYVLVVADGAFLQSYQGATGRPFINQRKGSCEFCCIFPASPQSPLSLAWDETAPVVPAEAGPQRPSLATPAVQMAGMIAAITPLAPAPSTAPLPPPGTARTTNTTTGGTEGFLRFTFSTPDPRVDTVTGAVAPGTYCAPYRDGQKISSGYEGVGRYALPVPLPYKHTLLLVPPVGTAVEIGTVLSAFGQAGGGVEAFFPNGFSNPSLHYHALPPY